MKSILSKLKQEQDSILSELERVKIVGINHLGTASSTFELLDRKLANHMKNKLQTVHSLSKNHSNKAEINKSLVSYQRRLERFRLDLKSFKSHSNSEVSLNKFINNFAYALRHDPSLRAQNYFKIENDESN